MSSPREDSIRLPQTSLVFDFPATNESSSNTFEVEELVEVIRTHLQNMVVNTDAAFYTGLVAVDSGLPSGRGLVIYPNGNLLTGSFTSSVRDGSECKAIIKEGGTIQGDLQNGRFSGLGEMTKGENQYEGSFHNNQVHGSGKLTTESYEYKGEFDRGKRSGLGEVRIANKKYIGQFQDDQPHGPGRLATDQPNGKIEILHGNFVKGVPNGEGKLVDSHGNQWFVNYDDGHRLEKIPMHEKQIRDLKHEVDCLNTRLEERGPQERCAICHVSAADVAIPACGHVTMCQSCESRLMPKRCPICRRTYREALRLIYS